MIENIILWGIAFYISIKMLIGGYKLLLRNENASEGRNIICMIIGIICIIAGTFLLILFVDMFYNTFFSKIHFSKRTT
ncbi:MAG TPA: hypothetical protein VIO64_04165 [Pseudobacteroides sp.]|uniref:hypothetical protein n=1 Tax=Pseudobacteroides sp. TaxID=1968840 RepID=UPI002F935E8A